MATRGDDPAVSDDEIRDIIACLQADANARGQVLAQFPEVAAVAVKALCLKILRAADGNGRRTAVVLGRVAGLSYSEIGASCHISKQAVHKHIKAIRKRAPLMAEALQLTKPHVVRKALVVQKGGIEHVQFRRKEADSERHGAFDRTRTGKEAKRWQSSVLGCLRDVGVLVAMIKQEQEGCDDDR
ncbi:MAG: hypothetical protein GY851_35510 [bacterium]|nr:hypothetical protein [bacterium]